MTSRLDWSAEDFRAWVDSHAPTDVLGTTGAPHGCPVACWQRSLGECVGISFDTAWGPRGTVVGRVPTWTARFVHAVDGRDGSVTAAECIAALTELIDKENA